MQIILNPLCLFPSQAFFTDFFMKMMKFIFLLYLEATIQKVSVLLYGIPYIVSEYFYKIRYRPMSKMH